MLGGVLLPIWGLLSGSVMLKSDFPKATGYIGLVAGLFGLAGIVGYVSPIFVTRSFLLLVFVFVWILLAGLTLRRLGKTEGACQGDASPEILRRWNPTADS